MNVWRPCWGSFGHGALHKPRSKKSEVAFRYKEEEDQSENNWRNRKYVRLTVECCDLYFLEECGHWDWSSWSSSQHICFPSKLTNVPGQVN